MKGSKKILKFFLSVIQENVEKPEEQTAYVLHADNMEAAQRMKELMVENVPFGGIEIQDIGPVIGCHTGPACLPSSSWVKRSPTDIAKRWTETIPVLFV